LLPGEFSYIFDWQSVAGFTKFSHYSHGSQNCTGQHGEITKKNALRLEKSKIM